MLYLKAVKNSVSKDLHSLSKKPPTTRTSFLNGENTFSRLITAPAASSYAPKTSKESLEFNIAPEHILHGSSVT